MGLEFLLTLSVISLAVCLAAGGVFLYAVRRESRTGRRRTNDGRREASHLAALFQTMRDIVSQQKEMAREFNEELDKKVTVVKQILTQSVEKNERIFEEQQRIRKELREVREEIQSLQRQKGILKEQSPALRLYEGSPPEEPKASGFVQWLTPPLPDDTAPPHPADAAVPSVDSAESHNAFRALLDLQPLAPETVPDKAGPAPGSSGDNGGQSITPVQKRVLEYSQAGMPVPEIARELGIGKGEVRLMLSLLKQKRT